MDVEYTYSLPGADQSHPIEIDVSGQSMIYLLVTDGGDASDSDYPAWIDGSFRFPDGSERALSSEGLVEQLLPNGSPAPGRNICGNPLHVSIQAPYPRTVRDRLCAEPERMNRTNPLYRENTISWGRVLALQAPSLLAFRVPGDATTFVVTASAYWRSRKFARSRANKRRGTWYSSSDCLARCKGSCVRPTNTF